MPVRGAAPRWVSSRWHGKCRDYTLPCERVLSEFGPPAPPVLGRFRQIAGARVVPSRWFDPSQRAPVAFVGTVLPEVFACSCRGAGCRIATGIRAAVDCPTSAPRPSRTIPFDHRRRDREQAHIPAEQPPPSQDPRFPAADAYPGRSGHRGRPPPQGPLRAVRLRHRACWRPPTGCGRPQTSERVSARREARAAAAGCSWSTSTHAACESTAPARVGFVVSKAVGGAVVRNRTKRRLRALMAARLTGIPGGCDVVVRANPAAGDATSAQLGDELDRLLGQVLQGARR